MQEDCTYTSNVVLNKTSITDVHACQELLITIGFVFNAEYFVYDSTKHDCVFYDKPTRNCNAISGPDSPTVEECKGVLTSPTSKPTTAKPATTKPTTAKPATTKPTTVKPATTKPTTAKPATTKATTAKPATTKPTTAKPATSKATTASPATSKATTAKP
jgi:hypothetical protein